MADRTEKHLAFRKLAVDIERTGADSVILISEAWLSRGPDSALLCHAADDPNREEALQLIAANANGDLFINTAIFSRDKKGNVRIEEEHFSTDDTINLLAPIKEVWRRRK